jgi:hypothetical protein
MADMLVLTFCSHTIHAFLMQRSVELVTSSLLVHLLGPELPTGILFGQKFCRKNAITRCVLNIDV